VTSTPRDDGFAMPAEGAPHERTLLCWPARRSLWGPWYARACADHAAIARAIARYERVTVVAAPADADAAASACGPAVDVLAVAIDDSWARDTGPIVVRDEKGRRAVVDFVFNGWGQKYRPWDHDDALAARLAEHLALPRYRAPMVLEGGAITVDGEGTLITTEQCLLNPNRNASLTKEAIESRLRTYLGVERVLWLPYGLAEDDDTDGHVDNVATFVAPGVVLVQGCDDPSSPDHERLLRNRRYLEGAIDAAGRHLDVVEVPVLPRVTVDRGERPVPYVNAYQCNGAVIVPVTGHPDDEKMLEVVGRALRDRTVVPVPGVALAQGGGGVHCITQQVPQ
jgi:agmatine deiminase